MDHAELLETASAAATAAAEVIRHYYGGRYTVSIKADHSPVTQADIESERVIRDIISQRFPGHGFYGEETGKERLDADFLWLVDPIDGTKSFVRGYPFFSTQIAVMERGELVVGVSSAPLFEQLATAIKGQGAWLDGEPIQVSSIDQISAATLSAGNIGTLAASDRWNRYGQLVTDVDRVRGYGDFYHYHLLASGSLDIVIESDVNILDIAALAVIVEAAGGRFTDLEGAAPGLETTSVLATNGPLHTAVQEILDNDR
jgi:histidinol-phosphatase